MESDTGRHTRAVQRRAVWHSRLVRGLEVISWPLQYTAFILAGCFLLDLCFDLPGYEVKQRVRLLVAWWQESDAERVILSFRN